MSDLKGAVGELHMKIQVTRKETGKVEEYDVVGFVNPEQLKQLQDEGVLPKQGETNG
jgi:hypothetical protein